MTFLKIEPSKKLSELLLKTHKSVFKVKYRNHLHLIVEEKHEKGSKRTNNRKTNDGK